MSKFKAGDVVIIRRPSKCPWWFNFADNDICKIIHETPEHLGWAGEYTVWRLEDKTGHTQVVPENCFDFVNTKKGNKIIYA